MGETEPEFVREFKRDAAFVFLEHERRVGLVDTVRRLAGQRKARREAFYQIEPFLDDFGQNRGNPSNSPNERLNEMLKYVADGRVDWPIAAFLAWLSYYHPDSAREFYKDPGSRPRQASPLSRFSCRTGRTQTARLAGRFSGRTAGAKHPPVQGIARDLPFAAGQQQIMKMLTEVVSEPSLWPEAQLRNSMSASRRPTTRYAVCFPRFWTWR
ncbi:MAG: hypothetical protein R3D99_00015 [Altererythrobacter sp.]